MTEPWGPVFDYDGRTCRALALEPTQHPGRSPVDWDKRISDEHGTWRVIRVDEFRGAHPTDRDAARGEWYTRRVTYALEQP